MNVKFQDISGFKITIYTNDLKTSPATCKLMDVDFYILFKEQLGAGER